MPPQIKTVPIVQLDIDSMISSDSEMIDTSEIDIDLNLDQDVDPDEEKDAKLREASELQESTELQHDSSLSDSDRSDISRLNEGQLSLTEHEAILTRRVEKIRRKILDDSMYKKFLDSSYRPGPSPDPGSVNTPSQATIDSLTQKALARKVPLYFTTPHLTEHQLKKASNWYTIGQRSVKAITKMINTESEKVRGRHFIIADIYAVLHAAINSGEIPQHKLNNYRLCTRIGELSIAQFQAFYSVWAIGGTLTECIDGTAINVDKFGYNTRTDIKAFCSTVFRELNSRLRAIVLLQQQALSSGNVVSNETVNRDLASSISPGATAIFASESVSALLSRVMAFARRRVIQNRCALTVFLDEVPLDLTVALCEKYPNFRALISAELPQRLSRELKEKTEGQMDGFTDSPGSDALTALDINKDKLLTNAVASGKINVMELDGIKNEISQGFEVGCVGENTQPGSNVKDIPPMTRDERLSAMQRDRKQRLSVSEYDRLRQQMESKYLTDLQSDASRKFRDTVDGNFPCKSDDAEAEPEDTETTEQEEHGNRGGYVDLSSI